MANPARDFYRALNTEIRLLEDDPNDPRYVEILQRMPKSKDPIERLRRKILFEESESVNLLTGFRGNGKSTELRRLKWRLEEQGCVVVLVDMANYMLFTKPVELSDFVLSLMMGLTEATKKEHDLDAAARGYFTRLTDFFKREVEFEFAAEVADATLGASLKSDPTFKESLQKALRGHYKRITDQAREYVGEIVAALREKRKDPGLQLVLLVDSVEQIRGIGISEESRQVHDSMVELFYGQASNLRFPLLHVVYTIPPFLRPLMPGVAKVYGSTVVSWPNVHVRKRDGSDDPGGLALLEEIVQRRYPAWRDFFDGDQLKRLGRATGGDLRDFFRVLREALIDASTIEERVNDDIVVQVESRLRREHLPIAAKDARWLAKVHEEKGVALEDTEALSDLARFFDNNLIMNYLNGEDWYDVHPLLLDEVRKHRGD